MKVVLDVTKTVLASELGARNETLSRALAKRRDAGHIGVEGRIIHVLNPAVLADAVAHSAPQFAWGLGGAGRPAACVRRRKSASP